MRLPPARLGNDVESADCEVLHEEARRLRRQQSFLRTTLHRTMKRLTTSVNAAMIFPTGFTDAVESGTRPEVGFFTQPDSSGQAIRSAIDSGLTTTLSNTAAALEVSQSQQDLIR